MKGQKKIITLAIQHKHLLRSHHLQTSCSLSVPLSTSMPRYAALTAGCSHGRCPFRRGSGTSEISGIWFHRQRKMVERERERAMEQLLGKMPTVWGWGSMIVVLALLRMGGWTTWWMFYLRTLLSGRSPQLPDEAVWLISAATEPLIYASPSWLTTESWWP